MDIVKIIAIATIAGVISVTIKKTNPEMAMQLGIVAGIVIFLMLLSYLSQAVEFIKNFAANYKLAYDGINLVLKVVGIAYICEFAIQVLSDAGEGSLASKVEFGGKIMIMVMTLPMLGQFAQLILGLL